MTHRPPLVTIRLRKIGEEVEKDASWATCIGHCNKLMYDLVRLADGDGSRSELSLYLIPLGITQNITLLISIVIVQPTTERLQTDLVKNNNVHNLTRIWQ